MSSVLSQRNNDFEKLIETNPFNTCLSWAAVMGRFGRNTAQAKAFYCYLSGQVQEAIEQGKLARFQRIVEVSRSFLRYIPANLKQNFDAVDSQVNLLFLAVQYHRHEIVKILISSGKYESDAIDPATHKTVFDMAIESNDTEMLKIFLTVWSASSQDLSLLNQAPTDNAGLKKIEALLQKPYQRCRAHLSSEMQEMLRRELEYNYCHQAIFEVASRIRTLPADDLSLEDSANRISLVIQALDILCMYQEGHQSLSAPEERTDIILYGLLAQNIRFLKRALKGSYADFPWEALEFFASQLLPAVSRNSRILELEQKVDPSHPLKSDDQQELDFLKRAQSKSLQLAEKALPNLLDDLKTLRTGLRKALEVQYLKKVAQAKEEPLDGKRVEHYEELYGVSDAVRDGYSLERILRYLTEAAGANCGTLVGRATLHRALQVLGEYIKHTASSPHLTTTAKLPLLLSGLDPKILEEIRDTFSHVRAFVDLNAGNITPLVKQLYEEMQASLRTLRGHVVAALDAHDKATADISDKAQLEQYYKKYEHSLTAEEAPVLPDAFPAFKGFRELLDTWELNPKERADLFATLPEKVRNIPIQDAMTRLEKFFRGGRPSSSTHPDFLNKATFGQLVDRLEVASGQKKFLLNKFDANKPINLEEVVQKIKASRNDVARLEQLLDGDPKGFQKEDLGNICKNLELDKAASQKWQGLFERVNNKSKDIQLSLERIFLKLEQLNEMLNENVPAFNELLACIRASKNSSDPDCVKAHLKFVQAYQSNHALRSAAEFMMLEIMEGLNRNANDKVKPLLTFSQHDRNYFAHGDALRDSLRFNPIAHSANTLINLFTQDQYLIFALQILRRVERLADGEARKVSIENLIVQEAPNIKSLEENLTKIIPGSGDAFFEKCIQEICKPEQVHRLKDLFLAQRKKPKKEKKKGDFADGSLDWSAYDIQFAWQTLENQTAIGNFEYLLQERDIALLARTLYQYDHVGDGLVDFVVIGSSAQLKHAIRAHQGRLFSHPNQALTMVINLGNAHWVTMVVRHNSDSSNSLSPHMVLYRDSFGNPMPEAIRNNLNAFYPSAELQVIPGVQQTNFHACGILALENARLLTEETAAVLAGAHAAHFNTVVSEDALNARRIEWAEKLVQNPAEVDLDARGVAEVFFSAMTAGAPVQQASNQSAVVPQ